MKKPQKAIHDRAMGGGGYFKISKGLILIISTLLITLTACQNSGPIIPPGVLFPPHDQGAELTLKEAAKAVDTGKILVDAVNKAPGTDVEYYDSDPRLTTAAFHKMSVLADSGQDTAKQIWILVTFTGGYNNGSCYINSGSILYTLLNVTTSSGGTTNSNVAYTAEASGLSVTTDGTRNTVVMDASELAGEVPEISVSESNDGNVSVSIDESVTVESSDTKGIFSSGNETVSAAETTGAVDKGDGTTPEKAYEISTAEQLIGLPSLVRDDGQKVYVTITDDITFPSEYYVDAIANMVISGAGDGIRITFDGSDVNGNMFTEIADTEISNITLDVGIIKKGLITKTVGDVKLSDIIVEGDFAITSNNTSVFVARACPAEDKDGNLTFERCINKVNFSDAGSHYGAPFVGFSIEESGFHVNFIFDECANEGDLFWGQWVSILIGNVYNGATPGTVTIKTGFENSGTISSFGNIAICSANNTTVENALIGKDLVDGFNNNIEKLSNTGISLAVAEGNKLKFTVTNETIECVRLIGNVRVGYLQDGVEKEHYASYSIPLAEVKKAADFEFDRPKSLEVIGSTLYTGEAENRSLVEYNGSKYWYVEPYREEFESKPGTIDSDGIAGFDSYVAIGIDANGKSISRVTVTIPDQV